MKILWKIVLILMIVLFMGCSQNQNTQTNSNNHLIQTKPSIPTLTNEKALATVLEASNKFNDVFANGYGIPGNTFSNEKPEVNDEVYSYLGSSIDTTEEFEKFLNPVFTDRSINSIKECFHIKEFKGKLIGEFGDAGSALIWQSAKIKSKKQNDDTATVILVVPLGDDQFSQKQFTLKYEQGKDWLIDTAEPFDLF